MQRLNSRIDDLMIKLKHFKDGQKTLTSELDSVKAIIVSVAKNLKIDYEEETYDL